MEIKMITDKMKRVFMFNVYVLQLLCMDGNIPDSSWCMDGRAYCWIAHIRLHRTYSTTSTLPAEVGQIFPNICVRLNLKLKIINNPHLTPQNVLYNILFAFISAEIFPNICVPISFKY